MLAPLWRQEHGRNIKNMFAQCYDLLSTYEKITNYLRKL